jgi:alpha-1,6-mannosyltransferase
VATLTVAICAYFSNASNLVQLSVLITTSLVQLALMAWITFSRHFNQLTLGKVALSASILCVIGLFSSPMLEDDHYRYLWDGFVTATTGRPYLHAPAFYFSDASIAEPLQALLNGINNPDVPTVYGPLLQVIFATSYFIAPGKLWPLKVLLLFATLSIIVMLRRAGIHPKWLLALSIHPLLIKESVLTAHPDLLIGAILLLAIILWQSQFYRWAALTVTAAVAIKVSTIAVLIVFCFDKGGKFQGKTLLLAAISVAGWHMPLIAEYLLGASAGFSEFGKQWVFNPMLFRIFAKMFGDNHARIAVIFLFGGLVLAITIWHRQHRLITQSVALTLGSLLLLSPAVNPWYWLWLLPIAALASSLLPFFAMGFSLIAYVHVVGPSASTQLYIVPEWAAMVQTSIVMLGLYLTLQHDQKRRVQPPA